MQETMNTLEAGIAQRQQQLNAGKARLMAIGARNRALHNRMHAAFIELLTLARGEYAHSPCTRHPTCHKPPPLLPGPHGHPLPASRVHAMPAAPASVFITPVPSPIGHSSHKAPHAPTRPRTPPTTTPSPHVPLVLPTHDRWPPGDVPAHIPPTAPVTLGNTGMQAHTQAQLPWPRSLSVSSINNAQALPVRWESGGHNSYTRLPAAPTHARALQGAACMGGAAPPPDRLMRHARSSGNGTLSSAQGTAAVAEQADASCSACAPQAPLPDARRGAPQVYGGAAGSAYMHSMHTSSRSGSTTPAWRAEFPASGQRGMPQAAGRLAEEAWLWGDRSPHAAPWNAPTCPGSDPAHQVAACADGSCVRRRAPAAEGVGGADAAGAAQWPHPEGSPATPAPAVEGSRCTDGVCLVCDPVELPPVSPDDRWPLREAERACTKRPAASAKVAAAATAAAVKLKTVAQQLHTARQQAAVGWGALQRAHGFVETPFVLTPDVSPRLAFCATAEDPSALWSMHVFILAARLEFCFGAASLYQDIPDGALQQLCCAAYLGAAAVCQA